MAHASASWLPAISFAALLTATAGCAGSSGTDGTNGNAGSNAGGGSNNAGSNAGGINAGGINAGGINAGGSNASAGTNGGGESAGAPAGGKSNNAGTSGNAGSNAGGGADGTGEGGTDVGGTTGSANAIWVRILPFGLKNQGWQLDDIYSGQDILDMIAELEPDVLSRFITGKPDLNWTVPMGPGRAPLKFAEYLNAATAAGRKGCFLTPRVTLNELWSPAYRLESAQTLYDLPVTPRLKVLDLDTYFTGGTAEDHERELQTFKDIGWTDLVYNFAGGSKETFNLVSYAMAGINGTTGQVALNNIAKMDGLGIDGHLAHIDYPLAIDEFALLTPDQQATIIQKVSRQQHTDKFTFVYPVLYGTQSYDSTKEVTEPNGPFKGATVFQVIKQMILCDRKYPQPCTPQFG